MRILQLHNLKRHGGGDEVVFTRTCEILRDQGHEVFRLTKDSRQIKMALSGKASAFRESIYSHQAAREMEALLSKETFDIVHAHNLFPLFSTSVLAVCQQRHVPVVFHCHSFFLTCPIGYHFHNGKICRKCLRGNSFWCLLHNCRGNLLESISIGLQHAAARKMGIFSTLVDCYITPANFGRNWLLDSGIPADQVVQIANPIPIHEIAADPASGDYIAFAGRFSPEKGFATLLAAIQKTGLPLHVAGEFPQSAMCGAKIVCRGFLSGPALDAFYRGARFLVVPSIWFETFALVAGEAMSHGIPVIASRIGALQEVVDDNRTGLLFNPGDADDLAEKMTWLWNRPDECQRMGEAGHQKAQREFAPDVYSRKLLAAYKKTRKGSKEEKNKHANDLPEMPSVAG
jgi:glycosyltransferase involved in cell wall biosynthesis